MVMWGCLALSDRKLGWPNTWMMPQAQVRGCPEARGLGACVRGKRSWPAQDRGTRRSDGRDRTRRLARPRRRKLPACASGRQWGEGTSRRGPPVRTDSHPQNACSSSRRWREFHPVQADQTDRVRGQGGDRGAISEVRRDVHDIVAAYENRFGLKPRSVRVAEFITGWGSCGPGGSIHFDWLVFAPKRVLEYVVVHELAHLKHRSHGEDFWALLRSKLPDYEGPKGCLNIHQGSLDADFLLVSDSLREPITSSLS
jgi:predicted metal-dependent hydrolase